MAFPSTFADLKNSVIAKLRLDSDADESRVEDWLNQIYADVCIETEALQTPATVNLAADTATYTLPDVVKRIKWAYVTPVSGTSSAALEPVSLEEIIRMRVGTTSSSISNGTVCYYALSGNSLIDFYPTPASADTVTIYYVKLPTALSQPTDVPEMDEPFASKLLEYGALAEGADFKRDPSEQMYRGLHQDWMRRYKVHLNRKEGGVAKQIPVYPGALRVPPANDLDFR